MSEVTIEEHRILHNDGRELVCACGTLLSNYGLTRTTVSLFAQHVRDTKPAPAVDRDAAGLEALERAVEAIEVERAVRWQAHLRSEGDADSGPYEYGRHDALYTAAKIVRAALSGPADEHPADGTGA